VTGAGFPLDGGITAAFTAPDRPNRMVETRPLVTTKSNRYVTFSARAIDHPAGPGQLPVGPHPSIREETACPASPRLSRPTTYHAS
jgi:hypothetical protein